MGAFVLFDVVSPWAADYAGAEIVLPAIFGAAAAQFGLIVILAALGDEYWPLRQLQALVLAVSAVWCLWVGFRLNNLPNIALPEAAGAAAFMPLALLSAQAPLWAVRLTRGWTIERPVNSSPAAKRVWRQFTILDLLMVTAMAAFALVSSQFGQSCCTPRRAPCWHSGFRPRYKAETRRRLCWSRRQSWALGH